MTFFSTELVSSMVGYLSGCVTVVGQPHCKVIAMQEGVAKLLQGKSKTLQSYCNARARHCKVIATFCGVLTSRGVD
jgi:hypothetical protein